MRELELVEAIEERLARGGGRGRVLLGPGDDAAVVRAAGVGVTSVDVLAEGVHFSSATHAPGDIGHKALGAALSDLAAMGASPGEAYVGLALPRGTETAWALELVDGMEALAARTATVIAGGDVITAPTLVVSVTVTGSAEHEDSLVPRSAALPGHLVGVTGELGGSGAGLALLEGLEVDLPEAVRDGLLLRHRRPEPRLEAGAALAGAGVEAMIDLSDGLATDAGHLARRSAARLSLRLPDLPVAVGVAEVAAAGNRDAVSLAATAGEDFELLFTAPPSRRDRIEGAALEAGTRLSWLGEVERGTGVVLVDARGEAVDLTGYEHS